MKTHAYHSKYGIGEVRKTRINNAGKSYYFWFKCNNEWEMDWLLATEITLIRATGERPNNLLQPTSKTKYTA